MTSQPRVPLTAERIIRAALEIIDGEGLDALSMRHLGATLGVDPMAIYHHVPSKAALFDAIVEQLWREVDIPSLGQEDWREMLVAIFSALRQRLLAHPRAAVLVGTRPSVTPTMLVVVDDCLGHLSAAGLAGKDAMQLIDCLSGFTVGKVLAEIGPESAGVNEQVASALAGISESTHPHLYAAMAAGYDFAPDEEFRRGLHALLDGWQ